MNLKIENKRVTLLFNPFVNLLAKEDFAGAVARFDSTMTRVIPESRFVVPASARLQPVLCRACRLKAA